MKHLKYFQNPKLFFFFLGGEREKDVRLEGIKTLNLLKKKEGKIAC
jgi:hypothetical protein